MAGSPACKMGLCGDLSVQRRAERSHQHSGPEQGLLSASLCPLGTQGELFPSPTADPSLVSIPMSLGCEGHAGCARGEDMSRGSSAPFPVTLTPLLGAGEQGARTSAAPRSPHPARPGGSCNGCCQTCSPPGKCSCRGRRAPRSPSPGSSAGAGAAEGGGKAGRCEGGPDPRRGGCSGGPWPLPGCPRCGAPPGTRAHS